jgi:hypothetical protein
MIVFAAIAVGAANPLALIVSLFAGLWLVFLGMIALRSIA